MRVLVTGVKGQLGYDVVNELEDTKAISQPAELPATSHRAELP